MLEFRQIDISDRQWVNELLRKSDFMGCEYSFANNMAWRRLSNSTISRYKDFYLIKAENENYTSISFPAGKEIIKSFFGTERICTIKRQAACDNRCNRNRIKNIQ